MFYNIHSMTVVKSIPAPEVETPSMDLNVKFFKSGIYIESMMTAEEDLRLISNYYKCGSLSLMSRINSWLFLNYEADKIGSFIFDSRAGRAMARNKTNINITRGSWLSSPTLDHH